MCINSGGEKIFAEEVEKALKHHPAVYDVVVAGTPSERWGEQVTAVVALRPGTAASEDELRDAAGAAPRALQAPARIRVRRQVMRAPTGKPDYAGRRPSPARPSAREALHR